MNPVHSTRPRLIGLLATAAIIFAACSSAASTTEPSAAAPTPASSAAAASPTEAIATPIPDGLLDKILKAGTIVVSTDPNYAPQSFVQPDGSYDGFDIAVAEEIGKRLGVTVKYETPGWDTITAGSWGGRWDISVGSMTITVPRRGVLDFSPAYYFTPAQMTATTDSGITSIAELAGKTVCLGSATTYEDWIKGTLESESLGPVAVPPADIKLQTLPTDQDCAQAIAAGRKDAVGFLTSSTTVDQAIKNGTPIVKIGEPVFTEQLAVSIDKSGPDDTDFLARLKTIIEEMHADGMLSALSLKWFDEDLTVPPTS